ncbi:MAG: YdcF family protein [Pseudomonadota bacterium]
MAPRLEWRWGRLVLLTLGFVVFCFVAGFMLFVISVKNYDNPDTSIRAEGIVVLTGGYARLDPAAELLRDRRGEKLLITGVNANNSADTMRDLLAVDQALFDCCVSLDREALDTVGNAEIAVAWARQNGFSSLLWVTNDYHMQRSLLEVRRISGDLEIIPFPVSNVSAAPESFAMKADRYRVLANEYAKYLVALVRTPSIRQTVGAAIPHW